jgi:MFS family permease
MASMCMVALEATIVSTAMPKIVADLGGLRLYSWVFAAFLLSQTALTVVLGNLADIYGRKPVMLASIAIFTLGSVLAGFAWSMPSLIAFRLVQGAGAGGMQPVAMTIIADLYPARERGKIQGYLASVWAVSAVLGPIVGAVIIRHVSWAWVFWINVPVGVVAAAGFVAFLHEKTGHEKRGVDVIGAVTFTIAISALLLTLTEIGSSGPIALACAGVFVAAGFSFVVQQRRSADPMVSIDMWRRRPIATANGVGVMSSMALMGLTTFVPIYVQVVLQRSPVVAGLALTTMLIGWPVGATLGARLFHRFGLQQLLLTGASMLPPGALFFVLCTPQSSPLVPALGSMIMGFGMGLVSVSSLVLVQEVVDWSQRGAATAANIFSRNLGSTLGAAVLGAVFNRGLVYATGGSPVTSDQLRQLLASPLGWKPADFALRLALQHSLKVTFLAMLGITLLTLVGATMVPAVELGQAAAADPVEAV